MEIVQINGALREVEISKFSAMDGWDIQRNFIEFAASTDSYTRRAYTFQVLSYAKVKIGETMLPLSTDALIDNHLQTWENIEKVFEAVLLENGIDPKTHADRPHYWQNAGAEMAISFLAEVTKLIGPAITATAELQKE